MAVRPAHRGGDLRYLPVRSIKRNPDNPRLIFRSSELQELADSIQDHGVQVPIGVFKSGSHYTLIDGERRWRACQLINLREIPAIIYPEPTPVQNIVFMFNIHRFRKDWNPLPTAMKLEELKHLITREKGKPPSEAELGALTGMSRGAVRRCKLIMEIPAQDRALILKELEKPEREQRITTDLYVECQRAVRTIPTYLPDHASLEKPLRNALIEKYKRKTIVNVVHMRLAARIARAATKGARKSTVVATFRRLIEDPNFSLEDAYAPVAWVYELRALETQANSLLLLLDGLQPHVADLSKSTKQLLKTLSLRLNRLLRDES